MISKIKSKTREKKEISSHIDVAFIYVCLRKFNFFLINFPDISPSCRFHLHIYVCPHTSSTHFFLLLKKLCECVFVGEQMEREKFSL